MANLLSHPTKIVLTGGTDGIGRILCQRLLGMGHAAVVVARRAEAMPRTDRLHAVTCDLSDPAAVRAAIATIAAQHPDVSIVINNAALQYDNAITDPALDPDRIEDEIAINLLAPALIIHGLLPTLRAHAPRAAIVNVNSGLALYPKRHTALYCATKAGLHSLSTSLRYQLEESGMRVIEAFLPLVDTAMTAGRGTGKISAEAAADGILAGLARGRSHVWIGKARLLPLLSRLSPSLARAVLRGPR